MTEERVRLEPGRFQIQGQDVTLSIRRAAEMWQFFAFVFAALVTVALALIDEIPDEAWRWRIAAKIGTFVGLA
jgi:hypothetical protein